MTSINSRLTATVATCALLAASAPMAVAQTPSDLRDLVGARAGQAEGAVTSRGYRNVRTSTGSDRKWSYWARGRTCVQITTRDGRYTDIQTVAWNECDQAGNSSSGGSDAAAAVVAGAAILGIAALLHHKDHHKDGQHLSTGKDEAEYDRGFNDGLLDAGFHNDSRTQSYVDGYSAGSSERQVRINSNRHPDYRGNRDQAPYQGVRACAVDAAGSWNLPVDRVVPTGSQATTGGNYRVTVQAGYRTAHCVVDRRGQVLDID